jgi:hypothetical protein
MQIMLVRFYASASEQVQAESLILQAFKSRLHDVTYVNCNKALSDFCLNHYISGLSFDSQELEKNRVCNKCLDNSRFVSKNIKPATQVMVNKLIDPNLHQIFNEIANIDNSNWYNYELDNFKVGRIAFYEFALRHKIFSLTIPDSLLPEYRNELRNVITVLSEARSILEKSKPDSLILYNSRYSVNNIFRKAAERLNIPVYTLNFSGNWDSYTAKATLFKSEDDFFGISKSGEWNYFRDITLNLSEISEVKNTLSSLVFPNNTWNWSTGSKLLNPDDLKKFFGVKQGQKIIVLTLSSADELVALEVSEILKDKVGYQQGLNFTDLEAWLSSILLIADKNPSLFFIIRLHPRDFPGARNLKNLSEQGQRIENFFLNKSIPNNVYVNYPNQNISIYDIMRISHLLINQSSSVGAEFACFGIPVLHSNPQMLFAYPKELGNNLENVEQFEETIFTMLNSQESLLLNRQVIAFRWMYFKFCRIGLEIKEVDPSVIRKLTLAALNNSNSKAKLARILVLLYGKLAKSKRFEANIDFERCIVLGLRGTHELAYLTHRELNVESREASDHEGDIPKIALSLLQNGRVGL